MFSFNCGDDGTTAPVNSGQLSVNNLKRLDQNTEGIYELWVSVETGLDHGDNAYRTLGRFNINTTGGLVDASGNTFNVNAGKIANLNTVGDGLITIESPGDNDTIPGNIRFLGGAKSVQGGTIVIGMNMEYSEILGSIAGQFPTAEAKYLLASPTTGDTLQFNKGVWFAQNTGGTNAGMTLPAIPDTLDWTYQAYVVDSRDSLNLIYNMGRFDSPDTADDYHQCEFTPPAASWQLPGQDWIQPNCPAALTTITDLNNGFYRLLVTLEPRFETAINKPFYLKLFYGTITPSFYGTIKVLQNYNSPVNYIPTASLTLTTN
jgi:hypothetical protein